MKIAQAMASYGSPREELFSSYFPGASKIGKLRETSSLIRTDHIRSS